MQTQLSTAELLEMFSQSEQDIHINHRGEAFYCGRLIASPDDGNPDFHALRTWCDAENYWPNVWVANDHGNVELYTLDGKSVGGLV